MVTLITWKIGLELLWSFYILQDDTKVYHLNSLQDGVGDGVVTTHGERYTTFFYNLPVLVPDVAAGFRQAVGGRVWVCHLDMVEVTEHKQRSLHHV